MKIPKFIAGDKITSIDELIKQEFVIFKAWDGEMKVYHAGCFRSWQLQYVDNLIKKVGSFTPSKRRNENDKLRKPDCVHEGTLPPMPAAEQLQDVPYAKDGWWLHTTGRTDKG